MIYIFGCLVITICSILIFKNLGIHNAFSKGIGIAIALSVLGTISLSQNYTQSLIPEVNDGIGISNQIAYWIIGEGRWSLEMFQTMFELSLYITLFLIMVYPIVLVTESKLVKKLG